MSTKKVFWQKLLTVAIALLAMLAVSGLFVGHVDAANIGNATSGIIRDGEGNGNCPWKLDGTTLIIGEDDGNYKLPNSWGTGEGGRLVKWPWHLKIGER